MDFVHDLTRYVWGIVRHPAASILGAVGLVLTIASAAIGRPIGLTTSEWCLVLLGSLVIGGFLDWRPSREMPTDHAHALKGIAQTLNESISGHSPSRYGPGELADLHRKGTFQAHFPELVEWLEERDGLAAKEGAALKDLQVFIESSGARSFPAPDGWYADSLVKQCYQFVREAAYGREPPALNFGRGSKTVTLGANVLREIRDSQSAGDLIANLNAWVGKMADSAKAKEIERLDKRRTALELILTHELHQIEIASSLKASRCGGSCVLR